MCLILRDFLKYLRSSPTHSSSLWPAADPSNITNQRRGPQAKTCFFLGACFLFVLIFFIIACKAKRQKGRTAAKSARITKKENEKYSSTHFSVFLVVDHNPLVNLVTKAATAENEILVGFIGAEHWPVTIYPQNMFNVLNSDNSEKKEYNIASLS